MSSPVFFSKSVILFTLVHSVFFGNRITCDSFQVIPDPTNTYKDAIEKATNKKTITVVSPQHPLIPSDDKTYSPRFLQNKDVPIFIQKRKMMKSSSESHASFTTTLSDQLRFENEEKNYKAMKSKPLAALPLFKSGFKYIPPHRNGIARKRFGYDEMPSEYWFDNNIHSLGNTGPLGCLHSLVAPLATKLIDNSAYDGEDVRTRVSKSLKKCINKENLRILDLCCGVGMSTRALASVFTDAEVVIGIDTSPEMIATARNIMKLEEVQDIIKSFRRLGMSSRSFILDVQVFLRAIQICLLQPMNSIYTKANSSVLQLKKMLFAQGNAERVKVAANSFDIITIMYAFHEIPRSGRYRILREARRLLKDDGTLVIVDISTDYNPSPPMLAGEPYVLEYQKNIMSQMSSLQGFRDLQMEVVVPGHVQKWQLTRHRRK